MVSQSAKIRLKALWKAVSERTVIIGRAAPSRDAPVASEMRPSYAVCQATEKRR